MRIELINLNFKYKKRSKRMILKEIDLKIEHPGLYGLSGVNGSGKTTLLKLLKKILKPTEGKVIYDQLDLKDIGYVDSRCLVFKNLTLFENLLLFSDQVEKIKTILEQLDLTAVRDTRAKKLSFGEKQRLCIARAILQDTPVLLLDEPTSHLDYVSAQKVLRCLKELSKNHIILFTSHYADEIEQYCDTIYYLEEASIRIEQRIDRKKTFVSLPSIQKINHRLLMKTLISAFDYAFPLLTAFVTFFLMIFFHYGSLNWVDVMAFETNQYTDQSYIVAENRNIEKQTFLPEVEIPNSVLEKYNWEKMYANANFIGYSDFDIQTTNVDTSSGFYKLNMKYISIDHTLEDNVIVVSDYLYHTLSLYGLLEKETVRISGLPFVVRQGIKTNYESLVVQDDIIEVAEINEFGEVKTKKYYRWETLDLYKTEYNYLYFWVQMNERTLNTILGEKIEDIINTKQAFDIIFADQLEEDYSDLFTDENGVFITSDLSGGVIGGNISFAFSSEYGMHPIRLHVLGRITDLSKTILFKNEASYKAALKTMYSSSLTYSIPSSEVSSQMIRELVENQLFLAQEMVYEHLKLKDTIQYSQILYRRLSGILIGVAIFLYGMELFFESYFAKEKITILKQCSVSKEYRRKNILWDVVVKSFLFGMVFGLLFLIFCLTPLNGYLLQQMNISGQIFPDFNSFLFILFLSFIIIGHTIKWIFLWRYAH